MINYLAELRKRWQDARKQRFSEQDRVPLSVEQLEGRMLLTAVSWDGGAGTANWHDVLNWSSDS